jgi:DNA/RNA endonuclease YhcR with UshA esterase domain
VTVTGTLKTIELPAPGAKTPYVLTLEENGTELDVVFWEDVFRGLENKLPAPGKTIRAGGRVDVFKDEVQLKVREAGDLRVMTGDPAEPVP